MKNKQYDLAIVGGGILGTFHAYHALEKGLKVVLIERNTRPVDATVRNFGQVVPSGMNSKWQLFGRKSLEVYSKIQSQFNIYISNCGSIYIASDYEELALIEELYQINKLNEYPSILLSAKEALQKYPALNPSYCKGALFFPQEVSADPRLLIHSVHKFLGEYSNFSFLPNTIIQNVHSELDFVILTDNKGAEIKAGKVIVCSGSDFETLFPEVFEKSDLELVKLQMLRLKPQKSVKIPGNILTGLSIRRYESFRECPSYAQIKSKEDSNSFWKKWGVHILFKQEQDGTIILGDSHEYADVKNRNDLDFYLKEDVNQYFISEAKKIMNLETWEVDSAWAGFYSQCKTQDIFQYSPYHNVHIVTGIGGKGMTVSAGFSYQYINELYA